MPPADWREVQRWFERTSELPAAEAEALLDRECADEQVRDEVRSLLAAGARAGDTLEPPSGYHAALHRAGLGNTPEQLGDYRLIRRLGEGGMGVVYEARDTKLDRRVAVKLVRPDLLPFENSRQRFENEIAALAKLHHPGVAQVLSCGRQDGLRFYAMEFVDGETLADVVSRLQGTDLARLRGADLFTDRPADSESGSTDRSTLWAASWVDACVRIVRDVALALAHAHDHGILHRDIKPGNVMLGADGRVRLLDFGLARTDDTETVTRSGAAIGSLAYMAPEQVRGDRDAIDARSDVYGLGVVLYELLTLRSPFLVPSNSERTMRAILRGQLPSLRRKNPAVGRDLALAVDRMLAREPGARHATAAQLAGDLDALLARRPVHAHAAPVRWIQRRPRTAAIAAAAIVCGMGALAAYAGRTLQANSRMSSELATMRSRSLAAESALDAARFDAYVAGLRSAQEDLLAGDREAATATLQAAPEQLRSWEWHHLQHLTRTTAREWSLPHGSGTYRIGTSKSGYVFGFTNRSLMFCYPESGTTKAVDRFGSVALLGGSSRALADDASTYAVVADSDARSVQIWDLVTRTVHQRLLDRDSRVLAANEHGVVLGHDDGTTLVIDVQTGEERGRLMLDACRWMAAALSADGGHVCGALSDRVAMFEVTSGRVLWQAPHRHSFPGQVAFSPDGGSVHVLAGSFALTSFRSHDGRELHGLRVTEPEQRWGAVHGTGIQELACDPDGDHLWTRHLDSFVRCLHLPTRRWIAAVPGGAVQPGHRARLTALAVDSRRGRLLTATYGRTVWDQDLRALRSAWLLPPYEPGFTKPAMNARGDLVVVALHGPPLLRDAGGGTRPLTDLPQAYAAVFLRERELAIAPVESATVLVYDLDRGNVVHRLPGHDGTVGELAVLADGRLVAGDESGAVRIWDTDRMSCEQLLTGHTSNVSDLAAMPDGRLATASWDGDVRIWDLATGSCEVIPGPGGNLYAVAVSPDGRWLASGGRFDGTYIYDLLTGERTPHRLSLDRKTSSLAFSPDGRRLVHTSHESGYVRLFDVGSWREVIALHPHHGEPLDFVAFAPDGTTLLTSDYGGLVRVWRSE